MSRMFAARIGLVLGLFLGMPSFSVGAIMVTYQGGTVTAGGTGFLDVMISSTALPATPDNLDILDLQFRITPIGGGALGFVTPQSESHLNTSNYVLHLDSVGEGAPGISTVSTQVNANDTLDALDATTSFLGVDLSTASGLKRLFRLDLDATGAIMGDQFAIQLVEAETEFSDLNGNLYLNSTLFPLAPQQIDGSSFNSFTVTAVPEPSSTGLTMCGVLTLLWRRRRRASGTDACN